MNVRLESMCHGDGKIYLQLVIDRLQDEAIVLLDARLKDGTAVPAHLFPFKPVNESSMANFVVVLPHLEMREADLHFFEYENSDSPVSESHLTVETNNLRWKTRINALVHNELVAQMLDIEREYYADRMNVYFTDAIDDEDEIVVKILVDTPRVEGSDIMVRFLDVEGHELDLPVYPLLDEVHEASRLGDEDRLNVGFSVRVNKEQKGFCVTVYDEGDVVPGGFAMFIAETYEPLHDLFALATTDASVDDRYPQWYARNCATSADLAVQRHTSFPYEPIISLILPVFAGDLAFLETTLNALRAQTYNVFELVVVDAFFNDDAFQDFFGDWAQEDNFCRIKLDDTVDYATAALTGLMHSAGDWCALLDPRIELASEALFEFVRQMNISLDNEKRPVVPHAFDTRGICDVLYSNHDYLSETRELEYPHFKPQFSPDLLYSYNYIGSFALINRVLLNDVAQGPGFANEAFWYDLLLKAHELGAAFERVDLVLYHKQHAACGGEVGLEVLHDRKELAFRGGRKAVSSHLKRLEVPAAVLARSHMQIFQVKYQLQHPAPRLSVIIPTKDNSELVETCICSLLKSTEYDNFEIVVVDNKSEQPETHQFYRDCADTLANFRVVEFDKPFHLGAMYNVAAATCDSDFLLFLDNDTEMINADTLADMVAHCARKDVGVVGAKLLFADDTIQHAGITVGPNDSSLIVGVNLPRSFEGYGKRLACASNMCAVSSACQMVKKTVFDEVGGYNEKFLISSYDVDFCLRVIKSGYQVVFDGGLEFYHHENATAGHALSEDQLIRQEREKGYFRYLWPTMFIEGDPYMSNGLHPQSCYFQLNAE